MPTDYVQLKNINGTALKPVTDLAAINMTTTNGIAVEAANGGTIGIRAGYIESCYYTEMVEPTTAANPESGFVSGGTMYTLLGGYAVTSDVPPATAASEYRVPSEKAVREAIDAYVATGGSDIVAGKGIDMGGGQINATEATVEETLKGYTVSGGTTTVPFDDQVVMPYDLRGALSLGQAVDVSCAVAFSNYEIQISGRTDWVNASSSVYKDSYRSDFSIRKTSAASVTNYDMGWWYQYTFPKAADGLIYLVIMDIRNSGPTKLASCGLSSSAGDYAFVTGVPNILTGTQLNAGNQDYTRIALIVNKANAAKIRFNAYLPSGVTGTAQMDIKNFRQYEVTALTDAAITALAKAEDPDAWFRDNTRSVNERYLIKPDMVSPWIPIIRMSTNSTALTVGAGLAYAVDVFGGSYTIGVDTFPEDAYGQDAHLELFVKAGSHVTFQPPLSLMDPLQENAGHNITIKFREGRATAHVEDTNYGYIINTASGTDGTQAGGSLYFAINGSTSNYAIFSAQLDGSTVTTPNVTANKDITIMGNGTDKTFISGTMGAASGKQLIARTLSIVNSTISGAGGITVDGAQLGDVVVASGSTVKFSGVDVLDGTVSGAGQIVFVNGSTLTGTDATKKIETQQAVTIQRDTSFNNLTYTVHGSHWLVDMYGTFNACTITDCSGDYGILRLNPGAMLKDCIVSGNTATNMYPIYILGDANGDLTDIILSGCTFGNTVVIPSWNINDITVYCGEHNKIENCLFELPYSGTGGGVYVQAGRDRGNPVVSISGSTFNAALIVESYTDDGSNGTAILDGYNIINDEIYGTGIVKILSGGTVSGAGLIRGVKLSIVPSIPPDKETTISIALHTPLDASAATTVQLTGTTFTSGSQISKSPSQIQLPANSINSFSGNTTAAGTKILKAGTIIVGDDRTNPTGSATIEFVGGSTALSGIGTYIAKDGTNDFVPIAGNVTSVTTATGTGAGSLQYALTSGTKYAKLANNLNASAGAVTVNGKTIVTSEYELILGGTFSLTSATVDEATKTVAIQSGGTMSIVDVRGGNDSVIDLGGTNIQVLNGSSAQASGCVFSNGTGTNNGGALVIRGAVTVSDCVFSGNVGSDFGGAVCITQGVFSCTNAQFLNNNGVIYNATGGGVAVMGATAILTNCNFSGNRAGNHWPDSVLGVRAGATVTISGCTFGENQAVYVDESGAKLNVNGSNVINKIGSILDTSGTVTISSGATIDLTGNTNATPINPGGGITFAPGGATVYPSAGSASAYVLGGVTVPQIGNTNVLSDVVISSGWDSAYIKGAVISRGTAFYGLLNNGNVSVESCSIDNIYTPGYKTVVLNNCVVSGDIGLRVNGAEETHVSCNNCTVNHINPTMSGGSITLLGSNNIGSGTGIGTIIISSGATINLTSSIAPGGGITVKTGGCTVNGTVIPAGTYTKIVSSGGSAIAS